MKKYGIIFYLMAAFAFPLGAQQKTEPDYVSLYNSGEYKKAYAIIDSKLNEYYGNRVEERRVPAGFISTRNIQNDSELKEIFRKRKAKPFFVEDNKEISNLHVYAARALAKMAKPEQSVSNYIQALRYRNLELKRDDLIFYELANVYRKMNQQAAYINSLETAYTLNPSNFKYSLEIAKALYSTQHKKRAIFHLERYIKSGDGDQPELALMLGNLYEDTGRYLETERYYRDYLKKKPDDGYIHFAIGYLALERTGNHRLAAESFSRALKLLPEKEIYRRAKSNEYMGDITLSNLELADAISYYLQTLKYQQKIIDSISKKNEEISVLQKKINDLKQALIYKQNFDQYDEYEFALDEKGKKESELRVLENEFKKLNSGKIRWNIAESYERIDKLEDAIKFYRESIKYDYMANESRDRIVKLQLKIKRGY